MMVVLLSILFCVIFQNYTENCSSQVLNNTLKFLIFKEL